MGSASAGMSKPYVHLHVHSAYSLLEGALPVSRLADLATGDGMPAVALTDTNNLFGALEFSQAMASAGIQPIIGCALCVEFEDNQPAGTMCVEAHGLMRPMARNTGVLTLLAQNEAGYLNLLQLSSHAFLDTEEAAYPFVTMDMLRNKNDGLIALTGGALGAINKVLGEGNADQAAQWLDELHRPFGDRLYVELQRYGQNGEKRIEHDLLKLAYDKALPIVATNEAYFATRDDFDAHDALICISESTYISVDDRRRLTPEHYFKSGAEMAVLFADLPEAIENTSEIAMRCAYRPEMRDPILPQSVSQSEALAADSVAEEAEVLRKMAKEGLRGRLKHHGTAPEATEKDYWDRLEIELKIITDMKYPGYFLIVADFIQWAKKRNIPVGPGRGSGAGSVVAWALTITDLDPIRFGLLFERFLNPARVSMPDFDIDFCQDRRDEVISYVQEKYGEDRVAQIITFGKLQARAVLRDVGRVLQIPYGQVDRLCKLVPNNPADPVTLSQAIAVEPKLQEERDREPVVRQLLDIGQKLEGLYRHASTHAAGIVIGDRPLTELVPLYRDPRSSLPATQFNMKWVEAAGLVKFDFLGLKTLTVIEKAKELIEHNGGSINPDSLPLDDKKTYELLSLAETVGVFQLESSGMRDALRKLKPDRFEDIIAMVALYRPGPMANIETYINRKHGREKPDYLHTLIRPILEETYGVIIYQEQVMQIAQELSGYSLGEADLLRRAMGKKIKKEMDEQKSRFIDGALANKVDKARADFIFELVARFAGYGFNKSHAAAYAMLAYQTAYLKANHPVEFLAASMTLDMGNTDKLGIFVQEAQRNEIPVDPPCVNQSESEFTATGRKIRYALSALKNMGHQAAEAIVNERNANGPYVSLGDFARRIDPGSLNKRGLQTLAAAGAFDALSKDRASLFASPDRLIQASSKGTDKNQGDMFGSQAPIEPVMRESEPWGAIEQLEKEFDAIGLYLSGHPLDQYEGILAKNHIETWANFAARGASGVIRGRLAGSVVRRQERRAKNGSKFAFIEFCDQTSQFEAIVFSDILAVHSDSLEPGSTVMVELEAEPEGSSVRARLNNVIGTLSAANAAGNEGIRVIVDDPASIATVAKHLPKDGPGIVQLVVRIHDLSREIEFRMPGSFDTSQGCIGAIKLIEGVSSIEPLHDINERR